MNKLIPIFIAVAAIAGAGSFYGGMKYSQSKASSERTQRLQQFGSISVTGFRNGGQGNRNAGGFTAGEILSKDEKSMTIKLRNGGSKIILYSDSTEVGKFVSGSLGDLEISKNISVNGVTNADGSITAQSIQLRPQIATQ